VIGIVFPQFEIISAPSNIYFIRIRMYVLLCICWLIWRTNQHYS